MTPCIRFIRYVEFLGVSFDRVTPADSGFRCSVSSVCVCVPAAAGLGRSRAAVLRPELMHHVQLDHRSAAAGAVGCASSSGSPPSLPDATGAGRDRPGRRRRPMGGECERCGRHGALPGAAGNEWGGTRGDAGPPGRSHRPAGPFGERVSVTV